MYNIKMQTAHMSDILPKRTSSDETASPDIQQRLERMRARYIEKIGEDTKIDLRRIVPDGGPIWAQIGDLRKEVYVDEHHYLPEDVLDENDREYDEYDDREDTVHICALDESGEEVVGYVRILTKGEDGSALLPAEKTFGLKLDDHTVEISRLISKKSLASPRVTLALIRAVMHELNANPDKYHATVATLENFLLEHLSNMGIPIAPLTDKQLTPEYNSTNMLVALDHAGIIEKATIMDKSGLRKSSPLYPERLGPWFAEMQIERGLGKIALVENNRE
jgi:N-acyl-L-homoserine lactone synthetase